MTEAQDQLLFVLHDLARLLRLEADRRARARGMTRAQWVILFHLNRRSGLSQKELAELAEVEPITVARLVDRLEAHGMVERRPDPKDRRIWRLYLKPPAASVLEEIATYRADLFDIATRGMSPQVVEQALATLQRMKCNIGTDPTTTRRAQPDTAPGDAESGTDAGTDAGPDAGTDMGADAAPHSPTGGSAARFQEVA